MMIRALMLGCLCLTGISQGHAQQTDALNMIEGVRGGRHWVDAKTPPPKTPQVSLASFQIEEGYEIQLFAAEPLVRDPVAITFDDRGDMYVVEYSDYPIGPPEGEDPLSKIVMLEDTNKDGIADRRHVFADKLDFAHSLMAYDGGLLVGAKTKILFLKDTDGDRSADQVKVMFDGFTPAHPQMQIGNPRWGIDNWIYLNYGPGKVSAGDDPKKTVTIPRKDVRFHPRSMVIEADSGLGQYGNTIDRWGNRFYCTNRNPIMTTFLSPGVLSRNPFHIVAKSHYDVGKAGGDTRVYPLVEMKSNYLSHAGTHTSACGTTAYTGDLGSEEFRSSVFVCEPIGHLVTRSIVESDGLRLSAHRARPKADFLASSDTWFRPSSLATGPDGGLYLADMYRLWVEHPKFLPPEISAKLDWRAGEDRGRIYRIVPKDSPITAFQPPNSDQDAVALLADPNGWRQSLGQRLLVEKNSKSVAHSVRELLQDSDDATCRLHAIWTLKGLDSLEARDVAAALSDSHPDVRIAGLRLAGSFSNDPEIQELVIASATDSEIRVRFSAALALHSIDTAAATKLLGQLAQRDGADPWFADGLLTSAKERAAEILAALVDSNTFTNSGNDAKIALVKRIASIVGARGNHAELSTLLRLLDSNSSENGWWRAAAITGLGQGLPRHRGELGRMTLAKLQSNPPESLKESVKVLSNLLQRNERMARDEDLGIADRAAAVELLAYQPFAKASSAIKDLLSNQQAAEIQTACVNALAKNGSSDAAKIVLERWSELGPAVRATALGLVLRRVDSTRLALDAMAAGKMNASVLSIDQRVRLLKHSDKALREQATELFGGAVSANRQKVAKEYEKALTLDANAAAGEKVFGKICANCHRINGNGHDAGPDLSDTRNRSKLALLYDILDPNSKVEPRFTAYSVLTLDGVVFNGLIVSETSDAVVLKMAEGKQQTIGRAEIDQIKVSDVSLMPEGIEKDVNPQQMADLLEYLKSPK